MDMGYVVFPLPQMSVSKAGVLDITYNPPTNEANAGDRINYTLTVKNTGNRTLTNVTLVDTKLGTLTCTRLSRATLTMGQSMVCTGFYILIGTDITNGIVYNTATGDSNETPAINAPEDVPIPKLILVKSAAPATYGSAGDTITYSYVLTNKVPST